jgi:CheY-like chemotaxis protein
MEHCTVLVADDDYDHVELVRRSMHQCDASIHFEHVADGGAVLDYLSGRGGYEDRATHPVPDLLLLDLNLPGIDGLTVLERIKKVPRLRLIPVLVLTSSTDVRDVRRAYEGHANGYLVKPRDYEKFRELMKDVWRFWLRCNRRPQESGGTSE